MTSVLLGTVAVICVDSQVNIVSHSSSQAEFIHYSGRSFIHYVDQIFMGCLLKVLSWSLVLVEVGKGGRNCTEVNKDIFR